MEILSQSNSYHDNTIWTLSIGGDNARKKLYEAELYKGVIHVYLPYKNRDLYKIGLNTEEFSVFYLTQIEKTIIQYGPENISVFILEPIIGSQIDALIPPRQLFKGNKRFVQKIRHSYDC